MNRIDSVLMAELENRIKEREKQLNERKDEMRGAIAEASNNAIGSDDLIGYGESVKRAEVGLQELIKLKRRFLELVDEKVN